MEGPHSPFYIGIAPYLPSCVIQLLTLKIKATETPKKKSGLRLPSYLKGQTIGSLQDMGDRGVFVSNSLGFSTYTLCSFSSTALLIPLI